MGSRQQDPNAIPSAYSGQIIGAIAAALDLDDGVLTYRTSRHFYQGRSVNELNRAEMPRALGEILMERGIVPVTPALERHGVSMTEVISDAFERSASRRDGLLSEIQSRSARIEVRQVATERLLRFVTIAFS